MVVFAPHPDDAEIHLGGTIAALVRQGQPVVVIDATRGELGSRGTAEQRAAEAAAAGKVLGLAARENLDLPDGAVPADDQAARIHIVTMLRRHAPRTVLCLSGHARHGDHQNLARLVGGAVKMAALHRFPAPGTPLAGLRLWFAEAELPLTSPAFLVPLTAADWGQKMAAIRCHTSQLYQAGVDLPATSIATPEFLTWIEARGRSWGHHAGAAYAEAFSGPELPVVADPTAL